ncbi:uncharacterized protein LOC142583483 [Dermacentor variabilis]|uniref:uncharacterized protein LOC142583483 n=1 Tax=Dermacentor variabilis TaxID=34621 RepID=UPI003F5C26F0
MTGLLRLPSTGLVPAYKQASLELCLTIGSSGCGRKQVANLLLPQAPAVPSAIPQLPPPPQREDPRPMNMAPNVPGPVSAVATPARLSSVVTTPRLPQPPPPPPPPPMPAQFMPLETVNMQTQGIQGYFSGMDTIWGSQSR